MATGAPPGPRVMAGVRLTGIPFQPSKVDKSMSWRESQLGYTFYGCGDQHYGNWPIVLEGRRCHIRTMFACFLWLPLFPVGSSIFLWEEPAQTQERSFGFFFIFSSETRAGIRDFGMFWPQVFNIYTVYVAWAAFLGFLAAPELHAHLWVYALLLVLLSLPLATIASCIRYGLGRKFTLTSILAIVLILAALLRNLMYVNSA